MGKCPFCKGEVQEDLLRFGGPCPHCFNTIPGEEAATDPGAKQRAAEAVAEKKKERKRTLVNAAVASAVLLTAVAVGLYYREQQRKEQELLTIQFDTTFDIFTADPADWANIYAEAEQVADAGKPNEGSKPPRNTGSKAKKVDDLAEPDRLATEEGGTTDVMSRASMGAGGLDDGRVTLGGGPNTSLASSDLVLKDQAQIQRMIGAVMVQNRGGLTACYEETLKVKPDFRNHLYTLYFTVNPDGTTSKVSVKSDQVKEPGFELCVANKIKGWKFTKVNAPRPIEYPYVLRSSG